MARSSAGGYSYRKSEIMAYPGDASSPGPIEAGIFGASELSTDELERLATMFRPSWELDDAPLLAGARFAAGEVRALAGEGSVDVRAAVQSTQAAQAANGVHSLPLAGAMRGTDTGAIPVPGSVRPPPNGAVPSVLGTPSRAQAAAPARLEAPVQADIAVSPLGLTEVPFLRRSTKPLWIALGALALALVGIAVWAASPGADAVQVLPSPTAHAEPDEPPAAAAIASSRPDLPAATPGPVELPPRVVPPIAAVPPPASSPRVASAPAATAQPPPPARVVTTTVPATPPAPRNAILAPPARPSYVAAPRPAPRAKPASPTIVRDVPF